MPAVLSLNNNEFANRLGDVLRTTYGDTKAAAKTVARLAGAGPKTAANWIAGEHAPGSLHLLRLMAHVPELQAEVRRLTGMELSLDPVFARDMQRTIETFRRMEAAVALASVADAAVLAASGGEGEGQDHQVGDGTPAPRGER